MYLPELACYFDLRIMPYNHNIEKFYKIDSCNQIVTNFSKILEGMAHMEFQIRSVKMENNTCYSESQIRSVKMENNTRYFEFQIRSVKMENNTCYSEFRICNVK